MSQLTCGVQASFVACCVARRERVVSDKSEASCVVHVLAIKSSTVRLCPAAGSVYQWGCAVATGWRWNWVCVCCGMRAAVDAAVRRAV
eukprot:6480493-Amphidinium_carterae.2